MTVIEIPSRTVLEGIFTAFSRRKYSISKNYFIPKNSINGTIKNI